MPDTLPSITSATIIRAIDIGHGRTKYTVDDKGGCRQFPSLAPPADIHRGRSCIRKDRDTANIDVDGQSFEVGPDTLLFRREEPVLHEGYIETPQYRALLYGALQDMAVPRIDLLVTGLPVLQHGPRSKRLQELLRRVHTINPGVTVDIREVAVVAQPLGGLLAHSHERGPWTDREKATVLVVDPGFYTVDWLVTRGLSELPGRSGHIEGSVAEYLARVQEHLSLELGSAYSNLLAIDEGLRNGEFRVSGKLMDLDAHRRHAQPVVNRAIGAIRNTVGSALDIDEIVLVGGGGRYFLEGLKSAFPDRPIHEAKDPLFANVRGFHLIGRVIHKRGGR